MLTWRTTISLETKFPSNRNSRQSQMFTKKISLTNQSDPNMKLRTEKAHTSTRDTMVEWVDLRGATQRTKLNPGTMKYPINHNRTQCTGTALIQDLWNGPPSMLKVLDNCRVMFQDLSIKFHAMVIRATKKNKKELRIEMKRLSQIATQII